MLPSIGVDNIVGGVVPVRQHCHLAILLSARDALTLAGHQAALMVECEPTRAISVLVEYADFALLPLHDPVRRRIAEEKISPAAEYGALSKSKPTGDFFRNRMRSHQTIKFARH